MAIVNQSFVHKFNLGRDAIGKRFSGYPYDNVRKVELEIVGVVADSAYSRVKGGMPPQYFQPRRQSEEPDSLAFYVHSGIDPDALMSALPGVVSRIDPGLPINGLITMRRQVQDNDIAHPAKFVSVAEERGAVLPNWVRGGPQIRRALHKPRHSGVARNSDAK